MPPGVYNLWPGFRAESLPAVDQEHVLELVQPILDHIRDVVTAMATTPADGEKRAVGESI